ncbi:MAG: hypothetical protein JWM98_2292, partial [Thermoleophilia bacterium]|nr:hypothetical protein [Thermoleophilia bacterium]
MRIPDLGATPAPLPSSSTPALASGPNPAGAATEIAAHRGFHSTGALQNTVAAYLEAIRLGADVMETDVRSTADGVLVLAHDAWVQGC